MAATENLLLEAPRNGPLNFRKFRFSGHDTFPCRYAWLPKAVQNLKRNNNLFADEDDAMVQLGVGKNMVRAIRFWADAADVAVPNESPATGLRPSEFGEAILGPRGHDEYWAARLIKLAADLGLRLGPGHSREVAPSSGSNQEYPGVSGTVWE